MCSIMCVERKGISIAEFNEGFQKTYMRGPDMSDVKMLDDVLIGFQRLSIMGLTDEGMQPFTLNQKYLVCNGEIYGFRPIREQLIAKGYKMKSESDCEILLPMYEIYGTDMFAMLDAEFVLVIYDSVSKELIAARDPIGIRPLFYGYSENGGIMFASEAKCLVGLTKEIKPFPPGYYYKNGKFTKYLDITDVNSYKNKYIGGSELTSDKETVINNICKNIHDKLVNGIEKRLDADANIGFLLSGGLDSSLVCSVAAKLLKKPIKTYAIGMNEDAIDLKYAKEVADYIGSEHTEIIIDKKTVLNSVEEVISILGTYDITTIRASIGMYLICKEIHKTTDVRVLLTGEISDELFGYKYTDFAPSPQAFQEESVKRVKELYMYDVLRADRCISNNSMEARVPFGDIDFVEYVMSIDPKLKINTYNKGKYLLRRAFEGDYLPNDILYREKAAFSDAVGHSMVDYIKEYAKNLYSDELFNKLCEKYDYVRPFTKESLMYREIFEKYYPGQAAMIKDYWMPNKNWEGCNVDDPSARVLKNYGASGL